MPAKAIYRLIKLGLQNLEIFIGARIEHASEGAVLEEALRVVALENRPAIVMANINLNGRQIDAILAFDDLTLVIETKGGSWPLHGGETGQWQVKLPSGSKNCRNPYIQALEATHALRDAMRAFVGSDINYYPSAAVVFVPNIPVGSVIFKGNFKASVIGLGSLGTEIQKKETGCWSLDQWRAFIRHHGLIPVHTAEAASNQKLFDAEQLVARYSNEYLRTYGPGAEELVEYPCKLENKDCHSGQIIDQISRSKADLLLIGPSGCGKSLLAKSASVSFLKNGGIPISIPVKEYQGRLKAVLDREVGLLGDCSGIKLLASAWLLNRPTLLILDGYNECPDERRDELVRSFIALSRRFESNVLVTSQIPLARKDMLSLKEVEIHAPDRKVKHDIAVKSSGGQALSSEAEALIDTVKTGLEARLIGKIGLEVSAEASRYQLFDTFVRQRLGEKLASGAIHALSLIAGWMSDRITFSISVRDLDRIAQTEGISEPVIDQLNSKGLFSRRADRISFGHELFLDAFASEFIIRKASGDHKKIAESLANPRHENRKALIVGAIDDYDLLGRVLNHISDSSVISSCLSGVCGRFPREWAEVCIPKFIGRVSEEIKGLCFEIIDQESLDIDFNKNSLTNWSDLDKAFIGCLPDLLAEGRYLSEILDLLELMDGRIDEEVVRLRGQVKGKKTRFRSRMFSACYVMQGPTAPAIAQICSRIHSGHFNWGSCGILPEVIQKRMEGDLSLGQIHLLATLSRLNARENRIVASFIVWAIKNYWSKAPAHLKYALVDAAGYCLDLEEPERSTLISTVESLLDDNDFLLNSTIFDILQRLGANEEEQIEYEDSIRQQIDQLLRMPDDIEKCEAAHSIYFAQFDHPYSSAYWEVVSALSGEQRKVFLEMALKGARDSNMFLAPLIVDVASYNNPSIGETLCRWTSLPLAGIVSPQEAIEVFVTAHIALARLGCELPKQPISDISASAEALLACGSILYWSNRLDLKENQRIAACREAWKILNKYEKGAGLRAIRDCLHMGFGLRFERIERLPGKEVAHTSIAHYYPTETAEVCRQALECPDIQVGYFPYFDKAEALVFAIDILGEYGNGTDLTLLRRFCDDHRLGRSAIEAIRKIEQRLVSV